MCAASGGAHGSITINFFDRMTTFILSAYPNARIRLCMASSIGCLLSSFGVMCCRATISDPVARHIPISVRLIQARIRVMRMRRIA
jgi:hypothetical protein